MPDSSGSSSVLGDDRWLADRELVTLHGNQPWPLVHEDRCWAIVEGAVDVFAVSLDDDGEAGARRHVTVSGPGQLLCGGALAEDDSGRAVTLLAVPSTTAGVVQLSRADVLALMDDPVERLLMTLALGDWAETLSAALPEARRPFSGVAATPGAPQQLAAGEALLARGGATCVRVVSGTALLASDAAMPVTPETGWVPLTGDTWLEAAGDVGVETTYLAAALRGEPGLAPVDHLCELLMAGLLDRYRRADERESARLRTRETNLRHAFARTLARQAGVLDAKGASTQGAGDDRVLGACRILGKRLGVRFVPPPTDWRDASSDPVAAVARASHVRCRRVRLEGEWWRRDNGPLLAFTAAGEEPVALVPSGSRHYKAWLPGQRQPVRVTAQLAAGLQRDATMFYRPLPDRPLTGRDVLAYTLRGNRTDLLVACLLALLAAVIGLALPVFTNIVFTDIVPSGDRMALAQVAATLFVIAVTIGVFTFVRGVVTVRVQSRVDNALQAALWDRLLALPPSFFRRFTAGDLASRVMSVNQMSAVFFTGVLGVLLAAVFSLVNLVYVRALSAQLALLALLLVLLALAVSIVVALLQVRERRRATALQGRLSGVVLQFVSAVAKLRDTGAEERAFMRWSDDFVKMTRHTIKATRVSIAGNVFNAFFPLVATAGAFAVFYAYVGGSFETASFMAYTAAFAQLFAGVLAFGLALNMLTLIVPLYERTRPILEEVPEVDRTKADPGELLGQIEMDSVTFSYDPDAPPTIRDLSLEVHPGEFVAVVGPSGAGKSTLFRLLLGFDAPDTGTVHYDGKDLRTLDLTALRRQISTVLQNGRVFSGSIQLNIAGGAQLSQDALWEAAHAAGLAEDIEAMPMGMFTYVAEGGVTLSGGQRQRLLIARALSTRPAILFFDEATSALDNRTQSIVMHSLETLNATRVVIAQRLSTVRAADRIYVLEDGRVAQCGTFDDLMGKPGLFRRLAERQLL
jgi:NHLM bacteriocin system ABC transporter ATP-binding protein